jgi:hypothetical protein
MQRTAFDYFGALVNNINWNGVVWCLILGTASAWRARVRRAKAAAAANQASAPVPVSPTTTP